MHLLKQNKINNPNRSLFETLQNYSPHGTESSYQIGFPFVVIYLLFFLLRILHM